MQMKGARHYGRAYERRKARIGALTGAGLIRLPRRARNLNSGRKTVLKFTTDGLASHAKTLEQQYRRNSAKLLRNLGIW